MIDEGGGVAVQILMTNTDVAHLRSRTVELMKE